MATSGGSCHADTPRAARTTKASRKAQEALHRNLDSFFDALSNLSGKVVSRKDTFHLQHLLQAMPAAADSTEYAAALDYTRGLISRHGAPELAELLVSLSAHRRQDKMCGEQVQAIEHCVRDRLLSLASESAATDLASLGELASNVENAAAADLKMKLSGRPDEFLVAAARCANPQLSSIAQEHVQAHYAKGVRQLENAYARLATAKSGDGLPTDMEELTSLLRETVGALQDHERFSAIHGLPTIKQAQGVRMFLDGLLRRPLERVELPLHLATSAQQQAICAALAVLEPMGTERPEDHFEAAYLNQTLDCVQRGSLLGALSMLKVAQDMRPQAANGRGESLQANLLVHLLTRMPRDHLTAWAKALDAEPVPMLMAAMDGIGSKIFAGQALGREIAERYQDLQEIRKALGSALGARVPKITGKFDDAIRNRDVQQALTDAFPLQINASPREVEVFARTGPVRSAAQAIFDDALNRDLTQTSGPGNKGDVEINGVRIAPGFLQAARHTSCLAYNAASQKMEPVNWAGNPAKAIDQFMAMTGATPDQMTAFSRIYDADSRIDNTVFSPWSVLQFAGDTTVFPLLSPAGQRNSQVRVKQDPSGNLLVRFATNLTGIASVLPFSGTQVLQPRAVAGHGGTAEFTHDIEIAPKGTCSKACLRRDYDLPRDATPHHPGLQRRVVPQDLVANPDALRALGQMVDRNLGTGYSEYLDNVGALLGIPKDNASNLFSTAQGMQFTFMPDDARSKALGISADAKNRVKTAMDQVAARNTPASIDRVVDAFRDTQLDVAQPALSTPRRS